MRMPFAGLIAAVLVLSLTATSRADIPPPPPAGLDHPPTLQPLPIVVAALAAAVAVAVGGVTLARSRGGWGVRIAALVGATAIVVVAAVAAFGAARARQDYDALKARYDDELSHWHSAGPVRPPRYFEAPLDTAAFAAAPQAGFPSGVPWGALARIYEQHAFDPPSAVQQP